MSGAFHHAAIALAQTTGFSCEERQIVLDLLKGVTMRGGAVDDLYAAVLRRLGARDFRWPEFDRWQAFFAEGWKFPPLWDELKKIPALRASPQIRHTYFEQKLYLLLHWLQSLETTRAHTRAALARYTKRGIRAEIARQGNGAPCPVCDPLHHQEVKDGLRDLPPFHPGCRCLVLAIPAAGGLVPGRKRRPLHRIEKQAGSSAS
ncbi:MAG: hypothetical protein ACREH7_01635 [Candidatus Rokuibacteriota bacterium]